VTLDPDVVVRADYGAAPGPAGTAAHGAQNVAAQAMLFRNFAPGARAALVNGAPGLVVFAGSRPYAVVGFDFTESAIAAIYILADPERLARMDFTVLDS